MKPTDILTWFAEINDRPRGTVTTDRYADTSPHYPAEQTHEWIADAESALQQVFRDGHAIRKQWVERLAHTEGRSFRITHRDVVDALRAIFSAATGQVKAGRLSTLADGIRAESVSELLDQADVLLAGNYHTAAAVITGGALETTLHHLCERAEILPAGQGSISKYEQALGQARKAGDEVISTGDGKQVIAWGDLRNEAAHTPVDFAKLHTVAEVRLMVSGVRAFLSKYP